MEQTKTKEEIAREYRAAFTPKEVPILKHGLTHTKYPRGIVFGCSHGNIGDAIAKHCGYFDSTAFLADCDWKDIARAHDVFIFTNSENYLGWIEDHHYTQIYDVIYNTLTTTVINVSKLVKELVHKETRARIIFIGSMAYTKVLNGSAPYCAAKAGLAHFAKCIAYELAPKGIEVFCVHPSNVKDTPMTEKTIEGLMSYRGLTREEAEAYWASDCPMGEFLTKQEIAEVVEFLAKGNSTYLAGTNIELSGGQR